MATTPNRLMGLGAVALVGACAIATLFVLWDRDDEGAPAAVGGKARLAGEGAPPPERSRPLESSASAVEVSPPESVLDTGSLHTACPSFRDGVDADCLAVLDRYFLGKPVYSSILPVADVPIWADIFDDPAAARSGTLATLSEGTCKVPNGDIRRDLGEVCDARSMVEQAVLLRECSRNHESVLGYDHFDRELSKIEGITDNSVYWRRRIAIEEDVFRSAWLAERCAAVSDATVPLDHFDISVEDITVSHPPHSFYPDRPLSPSEAKYYGLEEADRLIETAARLGNAWALSEFRGDAAHVERLFRSDPLQAYIHEAELEIWKVQQRYRSEHSDALAAEIDETLRQLDRRYPDVVARQTWGRARAAASMRGDHAELRRLKSRDPLARLGSDELDEFRERYQAYENEYGAKWDGFRKARREIRARREDDERAVRLTYAIVVEHEAKRAGVDADVMALYERAAPFSEADRSAARERAREIVEARRARFSDEEH
ncbi:MAG: hypothetical protein OXH09_11230 [Gammaproteobacteria bacterium]|nr:hypothetical protein [Gammaproteobacteria bacterium]